MTTVSMNELPKSMYAHLNNHERLALALNEYFEMATRNRFETLWAALGRSMNELDMPQFGWADGWRMRVDHNREADLLWGTNNLERIKAEID